MVPAGSERCCSLGSTRASLVDQTFGKDLGFCVERSIPTPELGALIWDVHSPPCWPCRLQGIANVGSSNRMCFN